MKKIFVLLVPLLMQACDRSELDGPWNLGGAMQLSVSDEQGNDLLNPTVKLPKSVDLSKIYLYHMVDGKEVLVNNTMSDIPKGFYLISPEVGETRSYRLYISLNTSFKESPTMTILQWENGERTVIKTEFYHTRTVTKEQKIWLNDQLVWDADNNGHSVERLVEMKR